MPECQRILLFIQGNRVAEEHTPAAELHADPHGKCTVHIRFACRGDAEIIQHGQHGAYRCTEGSKEVRPASRCDGSDLILLHKFIIGFIQSGKVQSVFFRRLIQSDGPLQCIFQIFPAFFIRISLCLFNQFPCLNGVLADAEHFQKIIVQCSSEAESLRRMADGAYLQRLHFKSHPGSADHPLCRLSDLFFLRSAVDKFKLFLLKLLYGIGCGERAGQRIETQSAPVNHGLPQCP